MFAVVAVQQHPCQRPARLSAPLRAALAVSRCSSAGSGVRPATSRENAACSDRNTLQSGNVMVVVGGGEACSVKLALPRMDCVDEFVAVTVMVFCAATVLGAV